MAPVARVTKRSDQPRHLGSPQSVVRLGRETFHPTKAAAAASYAAEGKFCCRGSLPGRDGFRAANPSLCGITRVASPKKLTPPHQKSAKEAKLRKFAKVRAKYSHRGASREGCGGSTFIRSNRSNKCCRGQIFTSLPMAKTASWDNMGGSRRHDNRNITVCAFSRRLHLWVLPKLAAGQKRGPGRWDTGAASGQRFVPRLERLAPGAVGLLENRETDDTFTSIVLVGGHDSGLFRREL
ncbi:hypothetical protein Bbelb_147760 [Branchiostoma belcheri]|nr:hypothetical protein Bbelb_147760 [Branchiostoma belcheri]